MSMLDLPTPELKFFADLSVEVAKPIEVGQTVHGKRRLIPILGGTVRGNGWTARVLPGGADFQLIVTDQMAELDARYALETDAGDVIYVENHAIRTASPEVMAKLIKGGLVAPLVTQVPLVFIQISILLRVKAEWSYAMILKLPIVVDR
jgi:hypothetical protein